MIRKRKEEGLSLTSTLFKAQKKKKRAATEGGLLLLRSQKQQKNYGRKNLEPKREKEKGTL